MANETLSLSGTKAQARGVASLSRTLNQAVLHVILIFFSVIAFVPFIWMVFGSFKHYKELVQSTDLLPHVWTLSNYEQIINRVNFLNAFANSVIVAAVTTAAILFTSSTMGYIFAKYQFPGREQLFTAILATMMVPFAIVLVPLYIFIADIHAADQLSGLIIVSLWSAFGIFLMRQFMEGIPSELIDAARIDGASEWRIFGQLMIPLSGAPLSALAILNVLGSWDNFLWPSIVLTSPAHQTIPVVLNGLKSLYWTSYNLWIAGSMLTVAPVMLIYVFASKQFVRGFMMTGIKG